MDRRTVWAILLMMVIAIAPALFLKKPKPVAPKAPAGSGAEGRRDSGAVATPAPGTAPPQVGAVADTLSVGPSGRPSPAGTAGSDTVWVTGPLYRYGIDTRGARLVDATLTRYKSMAPGDSLRPAQILPRNSDLLALTLVRGRDTIPLTDWHFTPSAASVKVAGRTPLKLSASKAGVAVELTYTFHPDDYRVDVAGRVYGVGPDGGLVLVGIGPTLANTEANLQENQRDLALVTKHSDTERTSLGELDAGEVRTVSGPFEWTALKSKYFVTALFAFDSTGGGISGATLSVPRDAGEKPHAARTRVSIPVPADGSFDFMLYAGPMEYDRLARIGHGFDDVNPYGWPGFRALIRVIAVPVRYLLVWMHEHLYLTYGLVLVFFGIMIRLILWPLNQKAMRANMKLQEVQPLMKDIQERYKNDPQKMQQEMFKLYKEYNVNPLGGCWPMLLPMPVLFALFFVFQNAIELRGTSFLWIPDLSRPDPLYVIPLLMGGSMYFLTKVGQMGMEPNPQAKMMLYMMPVMMTGMFLFFPSGLNLYYTVSNIASIPQQWLLARERQKRAARQIVEVKTAPEAMPDRQAGGKKKRKA